MSLTAEDRWAIAETVSLHGNLFDEGYLPRLDEIQAAALTSLTNRYQQEVSHDYTNHPTARADNGPRIAERACGCNRHIRAARGVYPLST